jgi:hypothetical protein
MVNEWKRFAVSSAAGNSSAPSDVKPQGKLKTAGSIRD